MRTHADIIKEAGPEALHQELGVSLHTVRSWQQRGSIPPEHWPALERLKVATTHELVLARPRRKPREERSAA